MEENITNFILNENISLDFTNFIRNLITVFILSILIQLSYNKFSQSLSNKDYFSKNFVVLGITTCIVITIVKSSLALSLGLVGALSIVRFRAAIKEPEELVYLFLVIAAGLGTGAGQIKITIVGILFTLIVIVIYYKIYNKSQNTNDNQSTILNLVCNKKYNEKIFSTTLDILNKNCQRIVLNSLSINDKNIANINFEISFLNKKSISNITKELQKQNNFSKIIFSKNDSISL
tara:strand:- start:14018 stop:14716 length:699 start_codon:yes stop_codon:yes gene_type:complete